MGEGSVVVYALKAILMGLQIAQLIGYKNIVLESDSKTTINLILSGCFSQHPNFFIIDSIVQLLYSVADGTISHTFKEANQVAYAFAKFGSSLQG